MNVLRWRIYVQRGEDYIWDGQLFASYAAALKHAQEEYGDDENYRIIMTEINL